MFKSIKYLLFTVVGLTVFSGIVPLVVALARQDSASLDRVLDGYMRVYENGSSAIFGTLKLYPIKEVPVPPPTGSKKFPKPETG
jgi:hypothetical protein